MYIGGSLFLFLVGLSLSISYSKAKKELTEKQLKLKYLKRGLWIFGFGLIITFVSWQFLGEGFIIFGVLHCIGLSIILAYPIIRFEKLSLVFGIIFVAIGIFLKTQTFDFNWLLWLGFVPKSFYTVDYFPLCPWFGVILIGFFIGIQVYPDGKRLIMLRDCSSFSLIKLMSYLGRNSLKIYFLHQPIILVILWLFFNVNIF
jgi:uncharacterized membrane protein